MDSDPYSTPEAKVTATAHIEGTPRPVRGIVFALVFDFVGTFTAALILTFAFGAILAARGIGSDEIADILFSEDLLSKWNIFLLCVGVGFSFYAGKICIQVSRGKDLLYPGILAGIGTFIGFVIYPSVYDLGTEIALALLGAGFVLLGANSELKGRRAD